VAVRRDPESAPVGVSGLGWVAWSVNRTGGSYGAWPPPRSARPLYCRSVGGGKGHPMISQCAPMSLETGALTGRQHPVGQRHRIVVLRAAMIGAFARHVERQGARLGDVLDLNRPDVGITRKVRLSRTGYIHDDMPRVPDPFGVPGMALKGDDFPWMESQPRVNVTSGGSMSVCNVAE